jgi:flagellar biogenesis protein FliO
MNIQNLRETEKNIRTEVWGRMITALMAAFGFVIALAWNDAVKAGIEYFVPMNKQELAFKFLYAIIVTLVVGILGYYVSKLQAKKEENKS